MSAEAPQPVVAGLFEDAEDGRPSLVGSRCLHCGEHCFPFRPVCPRCKRDGTRRVHLSRTGRLYSFTVCYTAPSGWKAPYFQAFIELPELILVFSLIADEITPAEDGLTVGMPMEMLVEPARLGQGGETLVAYKFRPVPA